MYIKYIIYAYLAKLRYILKRIDVLFSGEFVANSGETSLYDINILSRLIKMCVRTIAPPTYLRIHWTSLING